MSYYENATPSRKKGKKKGKTGPSVPANEWEKYGMIPKNNSPLKDHLGEENLSRLDALPTN